MSKLFSKSILKQSINGNWKIWAVFTGVLCVFVTLITFVASAEFSLVNIYTTAVFGTMGFLVMLVYAIAVGNKLVASEVDKGTLSFTLNTPITRKQIILSKALFYIVSLFLMIALLGVFATIAIAIKGAEIEFGKLWLLVLGLFLLGLATSGICFFASCWFNKVGQSIILGAGLPAVFWLCELLSGMQGLGFTKYLSLNSLFDAGAIVAGGVFWWQFIVLAIVGIALYVAGITKFLRKDLPL